jgi:hypothetical protein
MIIPSLIKRSNSGMLATPLMGDFELQRYDRLVYEHQYVL